MLSIPSGNVLAVDTETTGVKVWHGDEPFAFSFCNEDGETGYCEWPVDPWTRVVIVNEKERDAIKQRLFDPNLRIVMFNAKFDVRMLANVGINLMDAPGFPQRLEEAMFMAQICDTLEGELGLKPLAAKYLDIPDDDQKNLGACVTRLRRKAKTEGWAIAYEEKPQDDGTVKLEAVSEADYWLPQAMKKYHPEVLQPGEADVCETYARLDAERTMGLYLLYNEIIDDRRCRDTYRKEMKIWPRVYRMEERGVRLDRVIVEREEDAALAQFHHHRNEIMKAAWPGFNPKSPRDLQNLLYGKEYLNLEVKRRTDKSKEPATNVDALHDYEDHPIVGHLVKMRSAHKGWSSFFRKYRKLSVLDPAYGGYAIHTDFQQVGPVTGRFSSRTPNLQNVANALTTRSSEPIQARTPFGPRPGMCWFHWDYHQIEVRIFADVAQEEFMLDAIRHGRDLHTECTNKAWGGETEASIRAAVHSLELDGSGGEQKSALLLNTWKQLGINPQTMHRYGQADRQRVAATWLKQYAWDIVKAEKSLDKKTSRAKAKMLLFAKQFGGGPNAVKDLLRCSYEEAAQFLADYDTAFPRIPEYMEQLSQQARKDGCIINRYGRRISVSPDAPYRAVNYMVQGSAADLIKNAMIKVGDYLDELGLNIWLILQIHDELAFEAERRHAHRNVIKRIGMIMADNDGAFNVPTPVEVSFTWNSWDKKEDVDWCHGLVNADGTIGAKA